MSETSSGAPAPIVIKKYANRRLYNTGTSSYVTLEDLAEMVKNQEIFVVYDAKSGDDITRSVLTQIIFEQEGIEGQSLLPIKFLRQLILQLLLVVAQHPVQPTLYGTAFNVHDSHGVLLSWAVDTCVGLQVRLNTCHWSVPNNYVGSS